MNKSEITNTTEWLFEALRLMQPEIRAMRERLMAQLPVQALAIPVCPCCAWEELNRGSRS